MRGYFGIGVERISKPMNVGNLFRSAHAFGASFLFTVAASYDPEGLDPEVAEARARGLGRDIRKSDTSSSAGQVPLYSFPDADSLLLPQGCQLVGVELLDEAVALPSFRHPRRAAYILGPERGVLSPEVRARCAFLVQIPMSFCVNVGIAGAILMYDRMISLGRFAPRPVRAGGPVEALPDHVHGGPVLRRLDNS